MLHLPKAGGRFILYSDTSVEGTGSSLWQMQEGKARLLGYDGNEGDDVDRTETLR